MTNNQNEVEMFRYMPSYEEPKRCEPFSEARPLDPRVHSDHAQIRLKIGEYDIVCKNVSNPRFAHYFGKGGPFKDTHLVLDSDPQVLNKSEKVKEMEAQKVDEIIATLTGHRMSDPLNDGVSNRPVTCAAYVIVESTNKYPHGMNVCLRDRLREMEFPHEIITNTDKQDSRNVTTIIVNTNILDIVSSGLTRLIFDEFDVEEMSQRKVTVLPWVLCTLKGSGISSAFRIHGVHLPGNSDQYPRNAIAQLAKHIQQNERERGIDIFIGDFNCNPHYVHADINPEYMYVPSYYTHVNPLNEAVRYDYAFVCYDLHSRYIRENERMRQKLRICGETTLSEPSAVLVECIRRNIVK